MRFARPDLDLTPRRVRARRLPVAAALISLALFASACGDRSTTETTTTSDTTAATENPGTSTDKPDDHKEGGDTGEHQGKPGENK